MFKTGWPNLKLQASVSVSMMRALPLASPISLLSQILGSGGCAVPLSQLKPQHQKSACASRTYSTDHKSRMCRWGKERTFAVQSEKLGARRTRRQGLFLTLFFNTQTSRNRTKMMCFKFFSCRHIVLKVFLVQFLASLQTFAAPSPIIKFPGDETSFTDKEVALVSVFSFRWKNKAVG